MNMKIVWLMMVAVSLSGAASAGVAYSDPAGGWKYIFNGDAAATPNTAALDGTWNHDNGSDTWDLSGLGAGMPGGISAITEGTTTFLRIQDTGDPRDYGMPDPSNRKIYFTHDLTKELDAATAGGILTNGATISFRARLSTAGLLDQRYPNAGAAPEPWPTGGDGGFVHDGGKSFFGIRQNTNDWIISFGLALKSDHANVPADGLIMNRQLATGTGRGNVDTTDNPANSPIPYVALDPTQWHEFWITIEPDGTTNDGTTHKVTIWMDGSYVPAGSFLVTAGDGNEDSTNYIALGHGATDPSAAFDTDFFAYTPGAVPPPDPTFNPAPVVNAGPDQYFAKPIFPLTVTMAATVTDRDPQQGTPGTLSFAWSLVSGPAAVSFADATVEDPTVTFPQSGQYVLKLVASDGSKTGEDTLTVYVNDPSKNMLMAHWNFESITTANKSILDIAKGNNALWVSDDPNLTLRPTRTPTIIPGWIPGSTKAVDFSGAIPSHADVTIADTEPNFVYGPRYAATISAWVKVSEFTRSWSNAISKGETWRLVRQSRSGQNNNAMIVQFSGTTPGPGQPDNGPNGKLGISVNDNFWHHVCGTYDGEMIRCYIDGVLDAEGAYTGLINTNILPVQIGGNSQDVPTDPAGQTSRRQWDGALDEIRVYNYALTEAEIRAFTAQAKTKPYVNAGPDDSFLMKPGLSYPLAGIAADYGAPDGLTVLWTTVSGPAEAVFANSSSPTSTVTFPTAGVYTLKLTAFDELTALAPIEDTVVITTTTPTCADATAGGPVLKTDLNGDCYVNIQDLALMVQNWTKCNNPEDINCIWPF